MGALTAPGQGCTGHLRPDRCPPPPKAPPLAHSPGVRGGLGHRRGGEGKLWGAVRCRRGRGAEAGLPPQRQTCGLAGNQKKEKSSLLHGSKSASPTSAVRRARARALSLSLSLSLPLPLSLSLSLSLSDHGGWRWQERMGFVENGERGERSSGEFPRMASGAGFGGVKDTRCGCV